MSPVEKPDFFCAFILRKMKLYRVYPVTFIFLCINLVNSQIKSILIEK